MLDDPKKYAGETLADPIEGREDGACKATVMIGGDGVPFVHSFSHGRTVYKLRYDAAAVRVRIGRAVNALMELIRLSGQAELDAVEISALVHEVSTLTGTGVRDVRAHAEGRRQGTARTSSCGGAAAGEGRTQRPAPSDGAAGGGCRLAASGWRA